ncbi:unnamed protein product, partial [Closterium sp. Naga37s-1]
VASDFIQKHVAPRRAAAAAAGDGVTATRVIVSSHNYSVTPPLEELRVLVARIEAAGADIVKFATTATDITDNARVFQILKEAQRPTIALVMGPKGLISRLLAPKFNAFLTFGAIAPGAESAPGQPTVAELAGTYRLAGVGPATHVFGLVGNPVGHSKGPVLHNAALRHVGYDGVYVPFLVDDVPGFLKAFDSPDFKGFSVTIPHKLAALECCQDVEPLAKSIGAANTIIRGEGGRLMGYNTDCMAAIETIEDGLRQAEGGSSNEEAFSSPLAGRLFVVVGAGGAGRALAFGAKERGADVIITNRSYGKAEALAAAVGGTAVPLPSGSGDVAADELAAVLQEMQRGRSGRAVLANTTSVGMHPHVDDTPVSKAVLQECSLVFDAVYTPMETRLLKEAKQAGAATVSGVEMFVGQAARQFELFTGKPAPVSLMPEEPPRARTLRNAAKRWSVPAVLHPASGRLVPMDDWAISAAVSAHSDGAPAAAHSGASSGHDDFLKNLTNRSRKWIGGGARTAGRPGTASFRDADNAAAATGAAPAAPPSLNNVPDPVLLKILMRVESPRDRAACALVSPRWFWLEKRSRRAVTHLDLSQPSRFLESLPLAFFPRVTSLALNCSLYRRPCSADRLYDFRELHSLVLEGGRNVTHIDNISKEISIKMLTQELAQCSALRHLVISQTVKGNPRLLERAFSSLPLLTYLDLGNLKIETPGASGPPLLGATDGMLREVARWCAVVEEVYVGPHATVVGVEAVAGKCKQLRVLGDVTAACRDSMHVMNKWATNEALEEVGRSCPSLRSLLIRCNADITDAGLVALAALNPNLTHLNVFALAHSLTYISLVSAARHWTSLETLILPFCERDDRADLPDLVKALSSRCPKLKVFSIGLCAHRYFEALLELLGSCSSLEYVYLYESCQEGHEFTMADLRKAAAKEKRKPLICYAAGSAEGI